MAGLDTNGALLLVASGALVAGLASSVHCFAMCGPLACAGCAKAVRPGDRWRAIASWQIARILGYGVVGGVLGFLGHGATGGAFTAPGWLPWVVVLLLVASALGLGERLPTIPGASRILRAGTRVAAKLSPTARAGAMGALVPLIPCGVLYGVLIAAFASGSLVRGAVLAAAFAVGGVPSLTFAQAQTGWMQRLPTGPAVVLRRVVPLVAAAVVVWRVVVVGEPTFGVGVEAGGVSCH